MNDVKELFSGIGVVIDESIHEKSEIKNGIQKIVSSLQESNFPLLEYEELPDEKMIDKFRTVSFILLDWNLSNIQPIPKPTIDDNIDFLFKLKNICFCPIFIFSDEAPESIIAELEEKKLYKSGEDNLILVKRKSDIDTSEKLFSVITEWLKEMPSIYVLKEWEVAENKAKSQMLWDFYSAFSEWPRIISKSFQDDGSDVNSSLILLLQKSLSHRINPPTFDLSIINKQSNDDVDKESIRKLLETERFVIGNLPDYPFAGDIYLIDGKYKINIRPDCDIVRDKKDLYILTGAIVDERKINSHESESIIFDSGEFREKINSCYFSFINKNIIEFKFRNLEILKWNDIKDKRIGRILPPYITRIQQKYTFYLQRQGLPAIPNEAIQWKLTFEPNLDYQNLI